MDTIKFFISTLFWIGATFIDVAFGMGFFSLLLWWSAGVITSIYWWTKDNDLDLRMALLFVTIAVLLGPFTALVGWLIQTHS